VSDPALMSLIDIKERLDLLNQTLGLFPPSEPIPIAAELLELSAAVCVHWLEENEIDPMSGPDLPTRLRNVCRQVVQADPNLGSITVTARELILHYEAVNQDPQSSETQNRLIGAAKLASDLFDLVAPKPPKVGDGSPILVSIAVLLCGLAGFLLGPPLQAEEVSTRHRGVTLLGNLELAEGQQLEDGIAMIVHGMQAHHKMEIIEALQKDLRTRGISTLAITLSLGQSARTGFVDCGKLHAYRPYDSLNEIDAWIGWLKNNGATDIVLIGHSQGGNQVAVYGAERRDSSVSALVLLAPATFDFSHVSETYKARFDADLPELLNKAQGLVQSGQEVEPLRGVGFLNCPDATVTAGAFVGWYAPSELRNTPSVLPREKVRTMVIVAGADEVVPDLAPAVAPLARKAARGKGEITVKTIDGADHFFRDIFIDDAADAIAAWLRS
jgi:pimeloyl-ACP methyl ester carboxylesterase